MLKRSDASGTTICQALASFLQADPRQMPIVSRTFSSVDLPNLQVAIEGYARDMRASKAEIGYTCHMRGMHDSFSSLLTDSGYGGPAMVGPVSYRSVDVDVDKQMDCVDSGIHLIGMPSGRLAVLVHRELMFSRGGIEVEVMGASRETASSFLESVRERARRASIYRGKIISIGATDDPHQVAMQSCAMQIAFHRFPDITREQIILPEETMRLVERNTLGFLDKADVLRRAGRSLKRGLLLHGKPGTGKTHTARWLAQSRPNLTTILLSGEQLWLIKECCQLARMLAPSMVIMEDVDLVATQRDESRHPAYQVTLHNLLNEMDGLRGDCEVLFLLTTNKPEAIEPALAARPGRIDQAIEFPLPDAECRRRLLALYGKGLVLELEDQERLIAKTEGASPAFIQEMIRKAALLAAEEGGEAEALVVRDAHMEEALRELLLGGGDLTRNLLGFTRAGSS